MLSFRNEDKNQRGHPAAADAKNMFEKAYVKFRIDTEVQASEMPLA